MNEHKILLNVLLPIMQSETDTFSSDICNFAIALAKYECVYNDDEDKHLGITTKYILNKYINHAHSNQLNIDDLFKAVNIYLIVREICRINKHIKGSNIFNELRAFITDVIMANWFITNNMSYYELASNKAWLCQYIGHITKGIRWIGKIKQPSRLYNLKSIFVNVWWAYNHKNNLVYYGTKYDAGYNVISYDHDIKWEHEDISKYFIDEEKGE